MTFRVLGVAASFESPQCRHYVSTDSIVHQPHTLEDEDVDSQLIAISALWTLRQLQSPWDATCE
jgi:hypothetical protein